MNSADSKGTIELEGPGGKKMKMAMPQMKLANTSMAYTCARDTLTTAQSLPKNTTMTTTYGARALMVQYSGASSGRGCGREGRLLGRASRWRESSPALDRHIPG